MKIELALKKRDSALISLRDLYSHAKHFGLTSAEITQRYCVSVLPKLAKTPAWCRNYIDGYRRALDDSLYAENLVFGCWIDGKFYSNQRKRADYYETQGLNPQIYCERSQNRTGHYWAHNLKPYFVNREQSQ